MYHTFLDLGPLDSNGGADFNIAGWVSSLRMGFWRNPVAYRWAVSY